MYEAADMTDSSYRPTALLPVYQDSRPDDYPCPFAPTLYQGPYPRPPIQQAHLSQERTMAQPQFQYQRHDGSIRPQTWTADAQAAETPSQHPCAPVDSEFYAHTPLPTHPYSRDAWALTANAHAYDFNNGLPAATIMSHADFPNGLGGRFDYMGTMPAQGVVIKSEAEYAEYAEGLQWTLPRQQNLMRPGEGREGSDFDTTASSLSPKSYFTEVSDQGVPLPPRTGSDQAQTSGTWGEYSSVSPCEIKQSPPQVTQSMGPGFQSQVAYPVEGGMQIGGSSLFSLPFRITSSVEQRDGGELGSHMTQFAPQWVVPAPQTGATGAFSGDPSTYQQVHPAELPYYPHTFVQPSSPDGNSVHANVPDRSIVQNNAPRRTIVNPEASRPGNLSEEKAQRDRENKMLLEGKSSGLTYKEIRAQIGINVAESTLRGRFRSLTKQKQERVRKPIWTPKDIGLLQEVVAQEFDRLRDTYGSLNRNQLLSKVSWKKVAEYIVEHDGSYRFGNSTCKKKWLELQRQGH